MLRSVRTRSTSMVLRLRNRRGINFLRRHAADLEIGGIGDEEGREIELGLGGGMGIIGIDRVTHFDQRVDGIVVRIEAIICGILEALDEGRHAAGADPVDGAAVVHVMRLERRPDALDRQGSGVRGIQYFSQSPPKRLRGSAHGRPCRHRRGDWPHRKKQRLPRHVKSRRMRFSTASRTLYIEQQKFPLPGADDLAIVLHLLILHVLIGLDEFLAQHLSSATWCSSACRAPHRD